MRRTRPFLKWAGGKQALAETLIRQFPKEFRRYFEPFLGGGSVFFTLRPRPALLSDVNSWLINTYQAVRDDWQRVAALLNTMENTRASYLEYRKLPPSKMDTWHRAAHLIYLNKTCFRGLFRVNKRGEFNVPYGEYQRRYYNPANLTEVSALLDTAELRCCDYQESLKEAEKGDFAYLDPPYHKMGGYSDFNRYTADKFREQDHVRLADFCKELDSRGIKWAQSNSNSEFVRSLYGDYRQIMFRSRREINLNSQDRDIKELLIVNYDPPLEAICLPGEQLPLQI